MLRKKYKKKFFLRSPGWDFFLTSGQTETSNFFSLACIRREAIYVRYQKVQNPKIFHFLSLSRYFYFGLFWLYGSRTKSWVILELFEEWVKEIDHKFGEKKENWINYRQLLSSPPCEKIRLDWVQFPPSKHYFDKATYQSRIHSLYKRNIAFTRYEETYIFLGENSPIPKLYIFSALINLTEAWNAVANITFSYCFKEVGTSDEAAEREN